MKLISLTIKNFRQFYGEQFCEFATDANGSRAVTVFHGYNGSGKTALLNAFVWCLYGECTPDLEDSNRLENEAAVSEAPTGSEVSVFASLVFERPDGQYRVKRTRISVKEGANQLRRRSDSLELFRINEAGEMMPVEDSEAKRQRRINQFLPISLYQFFFFNGERVERIANADAYDKVEAGVKTLLDIAIYERGEKHLRSQVERELTAQLQQLGDAELKRVAKELEELEDEKEALDESLLSHQHNMAARNGEIEDIESKQEKIEELAGLSKERDRLRGEEAQSGAALLETKKRFAASLSRNGYLAFSDKVLSDTERMILDARRRGEIPAKIKPQFVDDLLSSKTCICGAEVLPGTAAYERLVSWRGQTGLAELEEKISYTAAAIGRLRERRDEYTNSVQVYSKDIARLLKDRQSIKSSLAIIDEKLGDPANGEDATRLHARLKALQREQDQERADVIVCQRSIAENEGQQSKKRKELKALQTNNEKGLLIKRQLEAVDHVADAIAALGLLQKEDVRKSLDESIRHIWNDAAIKQYTASVTEDYRLLLSKQVGGTESPVIGASTGEKQVLALSFVGSLVKKARENFGKAHGVQVGGYYPLIMDSPFGSLEDDYRAKVAEWVPRLADQVVVLVSKSQWRAEVEEAMKDNIGKEYILELYTSKEGSNREIEIGGVKHPYVISTSDPTEKTMIREI